MVFLTIVVVAGVVAVAAGLVSGGLEEPASPIPARALPEGSLTGKDVVDLRFVQAFRGYRMDQVDAAMDQLAGEVDRLRGQLAEERSTRALAVSAPEDFTADLSNWSRPKPGEST
jgi:DivIVA domain-containing protein